MPIYRRFTQSVLVSILLLSACLAGDATAQAVIEMEDGWLTLGDSLTISGQFVRPRICPIDSSYVAYEVHEDSLSRQYIFHRPSRSQFLLTPEKPHDRAAVMTDSSDVPTYDSTARADTVPAAIVPDSAAAPPDSGSSLDSTPETVFSCSNLTWCPVRTEDGIWAAYLAGSGRFSSVYLFELTTRTSYVLWRAEGTPGGNGATVWGSPQWSPDGTCLAFTVIENGESDIFAVRNMREALEDTTKLVDGLSAQLLVSGEGNQFQPVWCPVSGSGLLAYTIHGPGERRLHIAVFDVLSERSYDLPVTDETRDYFGPTWNSGGRKIAFYHHRDIFRILESRIDGMGDYCKLGVASIGFAGDSLLIINETPPDTSTAQFIRILPNTNPFSGPEWLPGGRHLLISSPDDLQRVRFHVVSIPDFIARDGEMDYILRGVGGRQFPFPRDIDVRNRDIAFVYGDVGHSGLVMGRLVPNLILVSAAENIRVDYERSLKWEDFAFQRDRRQNVFAAVWDFLWSPIAGPDIGINKGIVPVAGGIIALAIALSGDEGGGGTPIPDRDWTPPEFPSPRSRGVGIRVGVGL